ncbi:hypothetical protein AYM40_36355 (plasmid) [Paraburkholderia phytofirmans OLGA172]|jgi:hypothetical protein|uniref:Uncharacterized protein n=1 Tax=Paraburkholderia phytofirmans OLGA172 TaxID=1417228 RepID=A0A160FWM3_9BURK|nr:hypothetical protein [Paraburkholderia phytofirmans]ANB77829.1 hypothetical protein AYM40_36355 [Paraburkholderia phytofirmans OLGA172]
MKIGEQSLRWLVEKWLAPAATPVHVTRTRWMHASQTRSVRVETIRKDGPVAIFFFQHEDGAWCVFPPAAARLTIRANACSP